MIHPDEAPAWREPLAGAAIAALFAELGKTVFVVVNLRYSGLMSMLRRSPEADAILDRRSIDDRGHEGTGIVGPGPGRGARRGVAEDGCGGRKPSS